MIFLVLAQKKPEFGMVICSPVHISFSWVKICLLAKNQLPMSPGSALKVSVGWGGGFHLIMRSHQLCLGLKLGCDNYVNL